MLVGNIPTAGWGHGELIVRVHNMQFDNGGSQVEARLVLDASTPDDPEHAFVDQAAIDGASVVVNNANSTEGGIQPSDITGSLGYKVALGIIATVDASGGTCMAEISVVLVLKDN